MKRILEQPFLVVVGSTSLLILLMVALAASWGLAQRQNHDLDDFGPAPAFTLTDQLERRKSKRSLPDCGKARPR